MPGRPTALNLVIFASALTISTAGAQDTVPPTAEAAAEMAEKEALPDGVVSADKLIEMMMPTRGRNKAIPIEAVQFHLGSAVLTDHAKRQLDEVGEAFLIPEFSLYKLEIVGHTDSTGSEIYNESLSSDRAQSVAAYLTATYGEKISERVDWLGKGESSPIEGLNPADPNNRRVEMILR